MKYFKIAFVAVFVGVTVGQIVYGLFELDFNDVASITNLL